MKIKKLKPNDYFILLAVLFYAWIFPSLGYAYKLLQRLPGKSGVISELGLNDYFSWLYKFAITAAVFLAVLMIVIGGFQIVLGGASEAQQKEGRERIKNAVLGLVLALSAFLILYVINPKLVEKGFNIDPISITGGSGGGGGTGSQQQCADITTCVPSIDDPCYGERNADGYLIDYCSNEIQCEQAGFTWLGCYNSSENGTVDCSSYEHCAAHGDACIGERNGDGFRIPECSFSECHEAGYIWGGCRKN